MADDTGDGVGTAPTRLVLVHDVEDPARNLHPLASGGVAGQSHDSDGGKTEISEETARALIEGLHAPRVPTRVPQTATSNGEHVARFYGETLPLPAHVQPDVPATIIDVTDRLPIVPFEPDEPVRREEPTTEPTRSLGHDTIPNGSLNHLLDDRRAPTVPSLRIVATEPDPPIVAESPRSRKLAFAIGIAVVIFALIAFCVGRLWGASSRESVVQTSNSNERPAVPSSPSNLPSAASVTASIDSAAKPLLVGTVSPTPSATAPKPPTASHAMPAKSSSRTLSPSPVNDTPVPHSARVEHEVQ